MNLRDVCTLVDYHYWARDRLLEAVEALTPEQLSRTIENSFPSVHATLLHLYSAEMVWYARWTGQPPPGPATPEDIGDLAALRQVWMRMEAQVRGIVNTRGEEGIGRSIEYRAPDGRTYAHPFWQMVQHLVNHGSYHRGQVTMMLRQLGMPPARQMDLSAFYRESAAPA